MRPQTRANFIMIIHCRRVCSCRKDERVEEITCAILYGHPRKHAQVVAAAVHVTNIRANWSDA